MIDLVDKAYVVMIANLEAAEKSSLEEISNANTAEDNINNLRNHLREEIIENLESGEKNYQTGVYYMDIINELEKMGDFMINVSQDLYKCRTKA
jgi:phosphate:Na+ symporter